MAELLTNRQARVMAVKPSAIVGIIRFSIVLKESNFFPPLSGQGYLERKTRIFDRARLQRRLQLFEDICLPSLVEQTDQNFNIMLITSRDLPDWAHDRLMGLVRDLPNVYVRAYRPQANIQRVFKRSVFEMLDPTAHITASFRLDDDDALACDYVARLRMHMIPENTGNVITFLHGHQLALSDGALQFCDDTRECGSAGLALVQKGRVMSLPETVTVHCLGGHRKVGQLAPVVIDQTDAMYVQTANGFNVTGRSGGASGKAISANDLAGILHTKFPHLDAETLERLHIVYP
ncbi:hypothetical protein A9Q96_08460 [Rhodobacterales bacterium 52_120_T64]|nr:hypothetical protein A9Q96_08460 [Rhodobacterales bacterium 52_120_T64]